MGVILFFAFSGGGGDGGGGDDGNNNAGNGNNPNNTNSGLAAGADPTATSQSIDATLPKREDPQYHPNVIGMSRDSFPHLKQLGGRKYQVIIPYDFPNSEPEPETWYVFQVEFQKEQFVKKYQGNQLEKKGQISWEFTTQAPPLNPDYKRPSTRLSVFYAAAPDGPFGKTGISLTTGIREKKVEVVNKPTDERPIYFLGQSKVWRRGQSNLKETFLAVTFRGNDAVSNEFTGNVELLTEDNATPGPNTNPPPKTDPQPDQDPSPLAAKNRAIVSNHLKLISLAFNGHHDVHRRLPSSTVNNNNLSWRVYLLPHLDATKLYLQFKLDEPWDSEHNKALIPQMPAVFQDPRLTEQGKTTFRAFAGPGLPLMNLTMYDAELHYQMEKKAIDPTVKYLFRIRVKTQGNTEIRHEQLVFGSSLIRSDGVLKMSFTSSSGASPVGYREIGQRDGTSNTILVVQSGVDQAEIWTKPDGLRLIPEDPFSALGKIPPEGFLALFANGQIRTIPKTLSPEMLLRLLKFNDGQPAPNF